MILGYIRVSKSGLTEAEQRAALAPHVANMKRECWIDVEKGRRPAEMILHMREKVILACRPGDVVAVASADRLGRGGDDIRDVLTRIIARGATILDAETGERVVAVDGLAEALAFLRRAERQLRRRSSEKAVRTRLAKGNLGGRPVTLRGVTLNGAKIIWADTSLTAREAAVKIGVTLRTAYRWLGLRGGEKPGGRR